MKHKFRKYISKRGSALFMVISVMTALIVTSMAMYYSVVSSRKTQYAIFNQQQSFQSALSLSESMLGAIFTQKNDTTGSGFNDLSNAMLSMSVGDTITTNGNGYISFDENGTKIDENQVGAYTADITLLEITAEGNLYDVAVTAMVNGTESIVHQYVVIKGETPTGSGGSGRFDLPLFIASGLLPTSSALNAGYMFSDVFYDSEYTYFMPYGSQSDNNGGTIELKPMGNVYAAGSLWVNYNITEADASNHAGVGAKPHTWIIRKDLTMTNNINPVPFKTGNDISDEYEDKTNRVIVGGNCSFQQNAKGFKNCVIYVYGDLNIEAGSKIGENVTVYVAGSVTGTPSGTNVNIVQGIANWPSGEYESYIGEVEGMTQDVTFYDWNSDYEAIEWNGSGNANFSWGGTATSLAWNGSGGKSQGYKITGVTGISSNHEGEEDSYSHGGYRFIIDTGSDPDNVYTIQLNGYCDGGKVFSWCPGYWNVPVWVIVRGKGSVVFEVPDGITYENKSYKTHVMHENWATSKWGDHSSRDQAKNLLTEGWIHYNCPDNCCVNEITVTSEVCPTEGCNELMSLITCSDHNLRKVVCLACNPSAVKTKEVTSNGQTKLYSYGTCEYRVQDRGSSTPTTNIFLVMTGQDSKIQFTPPESVCTTNHINESFSSFWGYIYAPYAPLTYSAKLNGGDKTQFVGGVAVGSFNFYGRNTFIPAYPNKTPNEVMADSCKEHPLPTIDSKPWKESLSSGITA